MKCKSWSNKINNFVVRRLKSIKINSPHQQQQSTSTTTTTTTTTQQQYLSSTTTVCSTMPAMPKEKATAVSLSESNFTELKLKELATSAAVVAAMATTAATAQATSVAATNSRLQTSSSSSTCSTSHHQQQQQQQRSTCGCGAASVTEVVGSLNRNSKHLTNGHSSPLAAAVAAATSPQRNITATSSNTCCRKLQNGSVTHPTSTLAETATVGAASSLTASSTVVPPVTPPKKSPKDFIFGKYIGEGSFSIVYLAVDVNTKREYAIKVCEKRHILREHKQDYIRREREVMHSMTNVPGFVNLSCTFQDNRSLYFVMTYAQNGDLLPYINRVGSFDVDCTRHYAAELVLACEQMHRRNIVHRDLKPENILLDEDMHTLIADFGSAKVLTPEELQRASQQRSNGASGSSSYASAEESDNEDDIESESNGGDTGTGTGSDDVDSPATSRHSSAPSHSRYHRRRKGSFVGTAQYVSPEVLQNGDITPAADLWALGCIIYQMISGLPPFRGATDYVIFKEILACELDFPAGFDQDAADLVRKLCQVAPDERLGAQDSGAYYESIRTHPFFASIDFDTVRQQTPPPIYPYLPGVSKDVVDVDYRVPDNLEPGLDDKQLTRLLGMELGTALGCEIPNGVINGNNAVEIEKKTVSKNIFDLSNAERQKRLEQQKSDKWHVFADGEVILKKGYVNKRKGLFARKRMLLLTTGPRLIYIDPVQMVKKGEIPWSPELRVEARNFKIFFVHTPNRTYYLEDPEGYSLQWRAAMENMHALTYTDNTAQQTNGADTLSSSPKSTYAATTKTSAKTASN